MKDEILSELRQKMDKSLEALKKEFIRLRTGRASTALLDGIKVNCYGSLMPLDQVASLSVPESRLITIKPWDQSVLGEVEKSGGSLRLAAPTQDVMDIFNLLGFQPVFNIVPNCQQALQDLEITGA